jgi:hypothetical protein
MVLCSVLQRKKAEREFDLVASVYRNPEKQEMAVTRKRDKEFAKLNQVQQMTANSFNIISHQGPPRRIETMIAAQKSKGVPPRPYNFVTNMSIDDHQNAPLLFDETYTNARAGKPKEIRSTVGSHDRDFSIVNNNFYENHDTRKKQEYEKFKSHTLERYWATHDYDPVRGKFYDAEKEQQFREQRQILSQVHGLAKSLRVAPSIQYSDGNCYDILNHTIHDDGKCSVSDAVADRSLHRIKRIEKEVEARGNGELRKSAEDKRRLAKVSYKRWEEGIDRGFDFIKNSVTPADQPMPLPSRPASMWARLQTTGDLSQTAEAGMSGTREGRSGANTAHTANPPRATTASAHTSMAVTANSARVRNLSGAGPQFTQLRVDLQTRDTFPDSPATYQTTDAGHTGREYPSSGKPMTASGKNVIDNSNGGGFSARASRAATASAANGNPREGVRSRMGAVPSLDLSRAEPPEPVRYVEPTGGPLGLSVAMVRTGGLSGFRD